jgi:threonine dehydratase
VRLSGRGQSAVPVTTNSRREIFADMADSTVRVCGPTCAIVEYSFHVTRDFARDHPRRGPERLRRRGPDAARVAGPPDARRAEIYLKLETLQPIGSFKIRGAYNAVRRLTPEQLKDGVWTVSAGNAAQGVALAARKAGATCSVMVMDTAPEAKLRNIDRLGATIVKATYDECWRTVEDPSIRPDAGTLRPPVRRRRLHQRHGTAGLEIVEDLPDVDAVVAAVGGGGLLTGIGSRCARCAPRPRVCRRARDGRAAQRSMARAPPAASTSGRRRLSTAPAASRCSTRCGRCCASTCTIDRGVAGRRGEAMRLTAERVRVIAEGAGACAVAAAVSPAMGARGHKKVVAVVSGGNVDLARSRSSSALP